MTVQRRFYSVTCVITMPVPNVLSILRVINHLQNRSTCSCQKYGFYRPQRSCRKVMFLQMSVILFSGGGLCPGGSLLSRGSLCPGRGSLSRGWTGLWGISVQGDVCQGDPRTVSAGGTHSTGMHCCLLPPANKVCEGCFYACLSVILFTGGSGPLHAGIHPPRPEVGTPSARPSTPQSRHPPDQAPPRADTPLRSTCWEIRATSGRYAFYWNAFLVIYWIKVHLHRTKSNTKVFRSVLRKFSGLH